MWSWVAILVLLWPTSALSGTVLSGEHDGFTRVTVPVADIDDWNLIPTENGYDLRVGTPLDLDLSRVFERIGRDRVAEVTSADGLLSITLACQCRATAFSFRDRFIVIDVAADSPRAPDRAGRDPFLRPAPAGMDLALPITAGTPAIAFDRDAIKGDRGSPSDLGGLERSLIETLAKASSRGVLTFSGADGTQDATWQTPNSIESGARQDDPPGLTLRSGSDVPTLAPLTDVCWPEAVLDVASWYPDEEPFGTRLAVARAAMTDAGDRFDPDAVEALARTYVFYGFGQEAIRTLDLDGVRSRSRVALRALAQILDDIPPVPVSLVEQSRCSGAAPLWALAAGGVESSADGWDAHQILQNFKSLPPHLQALIGPRLADGLRGIDALEAARLVLSPGQKEDMPTGEAIMSQAALALAEGDIAAARAALFGRFAEDPNMPVNEVLQLVDLMLVGDEPIPVSMIGRLQELVFANRNEPIAQDVRVALGRSLARNQDYPAALSSLRAAATAGAKDIVPVWSDVAREITQMASDSVFLDFAFSADAQRPDASVQNEIAARLLSTGFPERAAVLLETNATGSTMGERRYLRAMAAMQLGDTAAAQIALAGISTPRALAILAGEPWPPAADATDGAWRNGDWLGLSEAEDPLLQSAAVLATRPPVTIDPERPLTSARALIADATDARAMVDAVLGRFQITPSDTQ